MNFSPQKSLKSPSKTPVKKIELSSTASPQRRLLFSPKESTSSPVKCSPTKAPAYQRYQSIGQSGTPALPLPFKYRFLAETFRCVDTVNLSINLDKTSNIIQFLQNIFFFFHLGDQ